MCLHTPASSTASNMLVPEPFQARCCTSSKSRVSPAAPIPVPTPVRSTASQKRVAPGRTSVEGIASPGAGGVLEGSSDMVSYRCSHSRSCRLASLRVYFHQMTIARPVLRFRPEYSQPSHRESRHDASPQRCLSAPCRSIWRYLRIFPSGRQIRLTEHTIEDAGIQTEDAAKTSAHAIVYYSEEAGHKVAHYFKTT
jgi:hypothetical protein